MRHSPPHRVFRSPLPEAVLLCLALLLCGLLTHPLLAQTASAPEAAPKATQVAQQLQNVQRLLTVSTSAKRVMESGNALAERVRQDALSRLELARQAAERGELEAAQRLLNEATQVLLQAVRMTGASGQVADRQGRDFEQRLAATRALLESLERIAGEQSGDVELTNTVQASHAIIASAQALMADAHPVEARALLDGGYQLVKASIESLRDGQTLVRSLVFETAQDEYRYELDRNDTHHMLVNVVVQERKPSAQSREKMALLVQQADALRKQAEHQALAGDYKEAIRLLDESTKELVRAIRGAGLYIPG